MVDPAALIPRQGPRIPHCSCLFASPPAHPHKRARHSAMRRRAAAQAPKSIDYQNIDFDIFGTLLSFYVRSVNILVSQALDAQTIELGLSGGTGTCSTF